MIVTIKPCFHWIGYHFSKYLLQEGDEVIGIDRLDTSLREFLYMSVGRNSNFQHFHHIDDKDKHIQQRGGEQTILYMDGGIKWEDHDGERKTHFFELPPLYGEWMDLEAIGVETKADLYQWVQEMQAIYVEDLLQYLIPKMKEKNLNDDRLDLTTFLTKESTEESIESVWSAHQQAKNLTSDFYGERNIYFE